MKTEIGNKLRAKLKEVSKGEPETWGFVAMFMDMIDEAEKDDKGPTGQPEWIKVSDRLPANGQLVLTYTPNLDSGRNITNIRLMAWFKQCTATHWQPLPEPPKE